MSTEDIFEKLRAPFDPSDLEWRYQNFYKDQKDGPGLMLPYVSARAIMDRLDAVVTPAGWSDTLRCETRPDGHRSWICQLDVTLPESGIHVVHEDGADETDIEPTKGGISDALKRVAVKFGIGRYLYFLPKQNVDSRPRGPYRPTLPEWAQLGGSGRPPAGKGSSDGAYEAAAAPSPIPRPQEPFATSVQQKAAQAVQNYIPVKEPKAGLDARIEACLAKNGPPPFDVFLKIPFGKYKDVPWAGLLPQSDGRQYLHWLSENGREDADRHRARLALDWWFGKLKEGAATALDRVATEPEKEPADRTEPDAADIWD